MALLDAAGRYAPRPDLVGATVGFMMQGNSAGLVLGPAAAGAIAAAAGWPAVAVLVATIRNRGCAHHGASGDPGRNGGPDVNLGRE